MTDLHPIYVGHFVHDGQFAETTIDAATRLATPRLRRKIRREELEQLPSVARMSRNDQDVILEVGYVLLELTNTSRDEMEVVTDLVNRLSCNLVDRCFRIVALSEL